MHIARGRSLGARGRLLRDCLCIDLQVHARIRIYNAYIPPYKFHSKKHTHTRIHI